MNNNTSSALRARLSELEAENASLIAAAEEAAALAEEYAADASRWRSACTSSRGGISSRMDDDSNITLTELRDALRRKDRRIERLTAELTEERERGATLRNILEMTERSERTLAEHIRVLQRAHTNGQYFTQRHCEQCTALFACFETVAEMCTCVCRVSVHDNEDTSRARVLTSVLKIALLVQDALQVAHRALRRITASGRSEERSGIGGKSYVSVVRDTIVVARRELLQARKWAFDEYKWQEGQVLNDDEYIASIEEVESAVGTLKTRLLYLVETAEEVSNRQVAQDALSALCRLTSRACLAVREAYGGRGKDAEVGVAKEEEEMEHDFNLEQGIRKLAARQTELGQHSHNSSAKVLENLESEAQNDGAEEMRLRNALQVEVENHRKSKEDAEKDLEDVRVRLLVFEEHLEKAREKSKENENDAEELRAENKDLRKQLSETRKKLTAVEKNVDVTNKGGKKHGVTAIGPAVAEVQKCSDAHSQSRSRDECDGTGGDAKRNILLDTEDLGMRKDALLTARAETAQAMLADIFERRRGSAQRAHVLEMEKCIRNVSSLCRRSAANAMVLELDPVTLMPAAKGSCISRNSLLTSNAITEKYAKKAQNGSLVPCEELPLGRSRDLHECLRVAQSLAGVAL